MYAGEKVTLRPFQEEHLPQYLEWVNDAEIASQVGRSVPVSALEHQRWYEQVIGLSDAVFFSIHANETGRHVGNVWLWGIHGTNRNAELRILIGDREAQGRGYGTEACRLLVDFAFDRMNLHKVFLYVLESNPRAKRAFEKAGFQEEGRLREEFFVEGSFRDVYRLAVLRSR